MLSLVVLLLCIFARRPAFGARARQKYREIGSSLKDSKRRRTRDGEDREQTGIGDSPLKWQRLVITIARARQGTGPTAHRLFAHSVIEPLTPLILWTATNR